MVAARLGHADPSITLRVYAHVISDQLVIRQRHGTRLRAFPP
ncbi:MAG TPA: hypothetical protein VMG38_11345 [Trebonia sp.]|nr:hypothetical protein [Trebonia sp.]